MIQNMFKFLINWPDHLESYIIWPPLQVDQNERKETSQWNIHFYIINTSTIGWDVPFSKAETVEKKGGGWRKSCFSQENRSLNKIIIVIRCIDFKSRDFIEIDWDFQNTFRVERF